MAWPYAVYTDPTFAATVLQAAAASAHANGTLPDIAAIANVYQYSAAAAAAAAGPSYFHGAAGGGDYGKFQSQQYVGPVGLPPGPPTQSLQQMMKKPFSPFPGHHHHHHHHHQFAADAMAAADAAEHNDGHRHGPSARYDNKTSMAATDLKTATLAATTTAAVADNNKTTSSSSSSSAADATDFTTGTSCKCGIVDCVLTTSGKSTNNSGGGVGGGITASTPPATVDRLPPPSSVSFFMTSGGPESGRDDLQSAECSLAVHKHVYHKEYGKNKLFQPYKPDVTTAKLNL